MQDNDEEEVRKTGQEQHTGAGITTLLLYAAPALSSKDERTVLTTVAPPVAPPKYSAG